METENSSTSFSRFQQINEVMHKMAESHNVDELLSMMKESGAALVNSPRATISRLNLSNGTLVTEHYKGPELPPEALTLQIGKGLTNLALAQRMPLLADDVRLPPWKGQHFEFWPDTRSELAVPIVINNAAVRIGCSIERAIKPIGVLNFESPKTSAFSLEDAKLLQSLANYGGVLIERLETDTKQELVAQVKEQILEKTASEGIIDVMLRAIKDTLGYDYVNISLVNPDTNTIKTEFVIGISDEDILDFKRLSIHSLESNDIQASVARTRQIEVPMPDDPRFDPVIYERFHHAEMIRVFIPMIAPTDKHVIGTVEAGYRRSEHRRHIYEQDVQILKGFIDYAAAALDWRQSWELGKIGHELRSPVVGIRNNARYLLYRKGPLDTQRVFNKLGDIVTDCEIVLSVIAQLEHLLGKPLPPPNITETLVFRDIIIKTIREHSPMVKEFGFDKDHITYEAGDMHKISPIWVDKIMLGQVFFNLLINSIKYAESDPSAFSIHIGVEDTHDAWLIKIQDNGIGVKPEYKDRIFEQGFRTPEARSRNVTGSGLGLTFSRQNMLNIGGDLQLTHLSKPTEFTVRLPKKLTEKPKEA